MWLKRLLALALAGRTAYAAGTKGAAAGQMVFHIHFHIVPRYVDVPLKHAASDMEQDGILTANADKIRAAVAASLS